CSYCVIPQIRGPLRSRTIDSLKIEANKLIANGVKEISLISQDFTLYGKDLNDENTPANLIKSLSTLKGLHWLRILYTYPENFSDELIDIIADSPNVCKYLDIPIQHFSDRILKKMNRRITGENIIALVSRIRERIPNVFLRTSLIVGLPGETDEDFAVLKNALEKIRFKHVGIFTYSDEEGTPSFKMSGKVAEEVKIQRQKELYQIQENISAQLNAELVGTKLEVLVEGPHEETELLIEGRHYGQAPEIDGKVIINDGVANTGELVTVEITESHIHDVVGKVIY
ncbi:MAG: MiaB/RimO family radical SAM methylthiotransferase, partial [Bacteriovoracia bacterium]